ncbi:MAG: hypothetical protein A2821_02750 [Candidatus Magasanikbacteria bacterium RIFCSPHIGHO2_01_FULL_41_23]|uniref:Uncharacterized protein n=1 Tax=Candidatus Magasanikbacteria bacterium RIFCSPLOWO2_01_FULL_40_15 TaxID=1798686 RepID=A0A1F6N1H1_9BACT|nr:MAG: hypothetical protein A2821_02750 [Candidatus Magasanikbacteria bacterium RIFCSPHIGHO2_01_FULL_41_23]OGH67259.1 MAG: hypothetical protein A3C66_00770 [Candidatus Magasanikbacteria bacterium RIFCSPHIGHO2_02_FULL_41_35]OGH74804.1 MAG: hypothetical protein A3F22_04820 [Candidatus Magasanikbacteria bacterium RIFCSPHIGHO2_12_FULL_41_16]OGH77826.1 MAG: hypothetical protein A2983_00320 [Candidatus Magasanikbacteria bacterium RIFCSPLOWO2_01_FULL_40_15]
MPDQKFDFMIEYIQELLKKLDLGDMTKEELDDYVPQLVVQAEARLGAAMVPLISEKFGNRFADLLEKDSTSREEWLKFWHEAVPNFDDQVKKVLQDFSQECVRILNPLSA